MERDKYLHIIVSAVLTVLFSFTLSWVGALFIVGLIGLAKELWDLYRTGNFSTADLLADGFGIFIGTLVYLLVGRVFLGMV
jgi:hypothetical protein